MPPDISSDAWQHYILLFNCLKNYAPSSIINNTKPKLD